MLSKTVGLFTHNTKQKGSIMMENTFDFVSFGSPHLFYLLTVSVEVFAFQLIALRHTQSVGLLWMRDPPVAETST
jgi:hypothetical protein